MSKLRYPARPSLRHVINRAISLRSVLIYIIFGAVLVSTHPTKTLDLLSQLETTASEPHHQESAWAQSHLGPFRGSNPSTHDRAQWLNEGTPDDVVAFTQGAHLLSSQGRQPAREAPRDEPRPKRGRGILAPSVLPGRFRSTSNREVESNELVGHEKSIYRAPVLSLQLSSGINTEVANSGRQEPPLGASSSKASDVDPQPLNNLYGYHVTRAGCAEYKSYFNGPTRVTDINTVNDSSGTAELINLGLQEDLKKLISDLDKKWTEKAGDKNVQRPRLIKNMSSVVDHVTRAMLAKIRAIGEAHEPALFEEDGELEENQRRAFEVLGDFWKNLEVPGFEPRRNYKKIGQESDSTVDALEEIGLVAPVGSEENQLKTEESDAAKKIGRCISKIQEKNALVWTAVAYWMRQEQHELYTFLGGDVRLDRNWKTLVTDTALLKAGCGSQHSKSKETTPKILKLKRNFNIKKYSNPHMSQKFQKDIRS